MAAVNDVGIGMTTSITIPSPPPSNNYVLITDYIFVMPTSIETSLLVLIHRLVLLFITSHELAIILLNEL